MCELAAEEIRNRAMEPVEVLAILLQDWKPSIDWHLATTDIDKPFCFLYEVLTVLCILSSNAGAKYVIWAYPR